MPYKFETDRFTVGKEHDRRRKLTDEQKEEIVHKYSLGIYSQRQLATEYGVSRRLIQFTLDPEKQRANRELHSSSEYYDKAKQREYMKRHRQHKKELYNKLKSEEETE